MGILKAAIPHFENMGRKRLRVRNDVVGTTWTIAMEMQDESVCTYLDILDGRSKSSELGDVITEYIDLITGDRRRYSRLSDRRRASIARS